MRLVCYWAISEADCEYPLDFYMVIPIDKIFYVYLKIKFIQRLYHSGKFQMFYHKAAVWGRWCLNLVFSDFMHHCASHPSESVLLVVKFWNCQSHIACKMFNFQTPITSFFITSGKIPLM